MQFFQDLILSILQKLGALIRWFFLKNKYTYKEVLNQNWNGRIGLLFITIAISSIIYF